MRATRLSSCIAAFSSVALAGVAAAGCSSSPSAPAGAAVAATTGTLSPSPAGLAAKLLAPGDLPAGWIVDATPSQAPAADLNCPLLNASVWDASLTDGEVDLSQGLAGPYLVERLGVGTAAQADTAWKAITDGVARCTTYTHTGSAGSSTFTIGRTTLPSYGDSSAAFTLGLTIGNDVHASGDIVAARSGNSVVVVYLAGVNGVTRRLVEEAVSVAVRKAHT